MAYGDPSPKKQDLLRLAASAIGAVWLRNQNLVVKRLRFHQPPHLIVRGGLTQLPRHRRGHRELVVLSLIPAPRPGDCGDGQLISLPSSIRSPGRYTQEIPSPEAW